MNVFISCPRGLQYLLEAELKELGLAELKPLLAGVEASASLDQIYQVLLWSRIANRVFLTLAQGKIDKGDDLYALASTVRWQDHFDVDSSFSVAFAGTNKAINNTTFGALKIKDAIVDQFRDELGERPSVDKASPKIRISAKLNKGIATISIDLAGESLHKRGYRIDRGPAPLKENVAAALLRQAGWATMLKDSPYFLDPMCGSGTFCIEAAMIATNTAPGLQRPEWGFDYWKQHDARKWAALVAFANEESLKGKAEFKGRVLGLDCDSRVIAVAWENAERSGMREFLHLEKRDVAELELPVPAARGLCLTNPPYGERLGEKDVLTELYRTLGEKFLEVLQGWRAGVFTGNEALEKCIGWKYYKRYKLYNGAIESALLLFEIQEENRFKHQWMPPIEQMQNPNYWRATNEERAQMFRNRLLKNRKQVTKWAAKSNIDCYRLYDSDMPEFAFAVDVYQAEEGSSYLYVQEYAPPKTIDERASMERLSEGMSVIRDTLDVDAENIFLKQRRVQKGSSQYEKSERCSEIIVREGQARLTVKLGAYLDTGLFLDHRPIRRWMFENANGKRVLNLFSYTSVVSVQAALGGATAVHSVDMSQTYLKWSQENFQLNKLQGNDYKFERANCVEWLDEMAERQQFRSDASVNDDTFDIIFVDPPSFSNSKRMEGVFDVQRDHNAVIRNAMKLLRQDGVMIFSTNLRRFSLDPSLTEDFKVLDKTKFSLDKDFERNQKIHQCWFLKHC